VWLGLDGYYCSYPIPKIEKQWYCWLREIEFKRLVESWNDEIEEEDDDDLEWESNVALDGIVMEKVAIVMGRMRF
jgi:hypothetical protein